MGMAIEVINHEFNRSIRGVRNRIRELKAWADLNEGLEDIYPVFVNLADNAIFWLKK